MYRRFRKLSPPYKHFAEFGLPIKYTRIKRQRHIVESDNMNAMHCTRISD